jgi:multidrug efflux pump subunit AcrA (membrane-fusion protein)
MVTREQSATVNPGTRQMKGEKESGDEAKRPRRLRRLVPIALALSVTALSLMPWRASVGSYGALLAPPEQETIIRSPESATLISLTVRPGQQVAPGVVIGQMGNSDLQDQTIQVQSELARANADYDRLSGELRAQAEAAARAELQLRQRQRDYNESDFEQRQIRDRRIAEQNPPEMRFILTSTALTAFPSGKQPDRFEARYPAAIAVLQSDVELREANLKEGRARRERARKLFDQGIVPRSELDASETRASTLAIELTGAQDRLDAALIEHRRGHLRATTEMDVAQTDLGAERLQSEKLNSELRATRVIIGTLEGRRELLRHKQAELELVTPRGGIVFGEELPRTLGQYYQKGAEICRVADTSRLLLRIKVPEREIGDVRIGSTVRLKARAFPDLTFQGTVTKIGAEGENDEPNQPTYRVELTIDNSDGLLRPGMSAFARIEFGRQMLGRIFLHKIKQALRPELWML